MQMQIQMQIQIQIQKGRIEKTFTNFNVGECLQRLSKYMQIQTQMSIQIWIQKFLNASVVDMEYRQRHRYRYKYEQRRHTRTSMMVSVFSSDLHVLACGIVKGCVCACVQPLPIPLPSLHPPPFLYLWPLLKHNSRAIEFVMYLDESRAIAFAIVSKYHELDQCIY